MKLDESKLDHEEGILTNDIRGVIRPALAELKGAVMRRTQGLRQASDRFFFFFFRAKNVFVVSCFGVQNEGCLWSAGYAAFVTLLLVCCCHLEHGPAVCAAFCGAVCLFAVVVVAFCQAGREGRVVFLLIFSFAYFSLRAKSSCG